MAFHYQVKVKAGYFTTQIKYRWQHSLLSGSRDSALILAVEWVTTIVWSSAIKITFQYYAVSQAKQMDYCGGIGREHYTLVSAEIGIGLASNILSKHI